MQATQLSTKLSTPVVARTAGARASRTVCVVPRAQQQKQAAAAAAVSVPALLAAHPALALVDDRLATEGTGLAFGISDPALFFTIAIVFTLVWSVFYTGSKNLGGDKGDDSGLTL